MNSHAKLSPPLSEERKYERRGIERGRSALHRLELVFVFFGFLILGAALTWPLATHMSSGLWGVANDNLGGAWGIEWFHKAFWGSETTTFTDQLQAPFGLQLDQRYAQPMDKLFAILFGGIGNGLFANNLAVLLSFPFAGLTMYCLAKYLVGSRPASVVAGVIFVASPFHLAMAMNYNALASIQWCPLVILTTLMTLRERRKRDAAFAGMSLALVWYTSYYYGWFALWVIAAMLTFAGVAGIVRAVRTRRLGATLLNGVRFTASRVFIAGGVFATLAVPVLFSMISDVSRNSEQYVRVFDDMYRSSIHPWQYVLPPLDQPLLGRFTEPFITAHLGIVPVYEQSVYIGVVAGMLALTGLLFARRSSSARVRMASVGLLAGTMLFAITFSLGPYIPLNVLSVDAWMHARDVPNVKNLAYYAYEVSSAFRYYGRAWVWGSVCLAALAAVGFAVLEPRLRRFGTKASLVGCLMISALVLLEFSNRPTVQWIDLDTDLAWVKAVEDLPDDAAIVQYPLSGFSTPRSFWYQYYQAVHEHPTLNPAEQIKGGELSVAVGVPDDPLAGEELHKAGFEYVVVHTKLPAVTSPPYQPVLPEDALPETTGSLNPWFDLYRRTPDAVIYKVRGRPRHYTPTSLAAFLKGFHSAEHTPDGRELRWIREPSASLLVLAGGTSTRTHYVAFDATSFHVPRALVLRLDGKQVGPPRVIGTSSPTPIVLPLRLAPGRHVIDLYPSPGIEVVSAVTGSADQRSVSVQVSEPRISEVAPDPYLSFSTGFGAEERDATGLFHWVNGDSGSLLVHGAIPGQRVSVVFSLGSYLRPRTVRVLRGRRQLKVVTVPADRRVDVRVSLTLSLGPNGITLAADPGALPVAGADDRKLSVQVSNWAVMREPPRR